MNLDFDQDPISLEIAWGRLQAIVDEAAVGLIRTAFSSIVRESKDFAIMLLDLSGQSIVQSTQSLPVFLGTIPRTMRAILDKVPLSAWRPGDVVGTNDPWLGTGHLPDVNLTLPVFVNGRHVAFAAMVAHMADIGGRGYASDAREVYEEGLRIPVGYFRRQHAVNTDLYDIITANVRLPRQVLGDIDAMIGAGFQVEARLQRLMEEMGLASIESLGRTIQHLSERAMRQAIARIPAGTYHDTVQVDGLGADLRISAAVTFAGDEVSVDFEGSSPQIQGGINSTYNYSYSYTAYALKCLLNPNIPINGGTFRPVKMTAPVSSIVNCSPPAAVAGRSQIGQFIPTAICGALQGVIPDRVIADCGSPRPVIVLSGTGPRDEAYVTIIPVHGGMGATPTSDGLSCIAFPTNTAGIPVEVLEATTPVLVEEKELIADSGGAGMFRGGLGQRLALRLLSDAPTRVSILAQRERFAPRGAFGGMPGGKLRANIPSNGIETMKRGDRVVLESPGGGGFGAPGKRSAEARAMDRKNGVVDRSDPE